MITNNTESDGTQVWNILNHLTLNYMDTSSIHNNNILRNQNVQIFQFKL